MGGVSDYQDPTKCINGCALFAQMVRFLPDQVETCFGTVDTMVHPQDYEEVTGISLLDVLGLINPGQVPILFGDEGSLLQETPAGSGALVPLTPPFPLPAGARMQATVAENVMSMAISDGTKGLVPPIRLNGLTKGIFAAQNPIGGLWSAALIYQVGDLVRSADGRWWRCTLSATQLGSETGPQWPQFDGYFSGGTLGATAVPGAWNPATAIDPTGGSNWEEWTLACAQYLPAPDVSGMSVTHTPGAGTIASGKDVYIKFIFLYGVYGSPRSVALVFSNTSANDQLTVVQNGTANGGLNLPRWIAEIFMRPDLFSSTGFLQYSVEIYVAAVAHGAAAPADSSYVPYVVGPPPYTGCQAMVISSIPSTPQPAPTVGCIVAYVGPNAPAGFPTEVELGGYIGQFGARYMTVVRISQSGSYSSVDPNAFISINLVGQLRLPIVTIVRDASGNVEATVGDVTIGWIVGNRVTVAGCTTDPTFNGSFVLNGVQPTLNPQGILSWKDPTHLSASNDNTGSITLPAGPPPVAFLPPGGPNDLEDIAAFTVVDSSQAGPYFFVSEADEDPFSSPIQSMIGTRVIDLTGLTLTRDGGGFVTTPVADISGMSIGDLAIITEATDVSFDGQYVLTGVDATTGTAGILTWNQGDQTASSVTANLSIQIGEVSSVQITVNDASGFSAGDAVLVNTGALAATGVASGFDGVAEVASITQNVVTVASLGVGGATLYPGASLTLIQNLPTCSGAGTQAISTISRDAKGNVQASVPSVLGYAAGMMVEVEDVPSGGFDGSFELVTVQLNLDGTTGILGWSQPGLAAAMDVSGAGTLSSPSDILINYDDSLLTEETEVTRQLSMSPPPNSADVYFIPSLRMYAYTRGIDSLFVISQQDDAENVNLGNAQLSVDDNSMTLAICVREARTGEIIALKQDSGYAINSSDLPPSQWPCPTRWKEHGPPCAAAVGKGLDFLVFPSFWSQAGCYLYRNGELSWLTLEFQKVWDRVNKAALNTIWCVVDEQEKEILIGLPLDGASTPSDIVVGSYIAGWGEVQEVLNRYGKLITARAAVRWSIRPRAIRTAAIVQRTLTAPSESLQGPYAFESVSVTGGLVTAEYIGVSGQLPIDAITRTGGSVTAIYATHVPQVLPISVGEIVPITGVADSSFDGSFKITAIVGFFVPLLHHPPVFVGYKISWVQAGPDASSMGGLIGTSAPQTVPPVEVPGGIVFVNSVANPSFNGTFVVVASTPTSLSWIQNIIQGAIRPNSWSWANGSSGHGSATFLFAGVIPGGLVGGTKAYIRGTNSPMDAGIFAVASVTQFAGYYAVVLTFTAVFAPNASSGINGLVLFFIPPADASSGPGLSYVSLIVPTPTTDERVQNRQLLLGPSGPDPFQTVEIVSADRRTGVRGDLTVGGVLTLRFQGPLDGNVSTVIVNGMDDESFDGVYSVPCTAAWGSDGQHDYLQFETEGPTGVAFGGTLQSTQSCLRVVMQDPSRLDDNGMGLDSRYTPAFSQAGNLMVIRWGAFNVQLGGKGTIQLLPQTDDPDEVFEPIEILVPSEKPKRIQEGLRVPDNEYLTLSVSNGKVPGTGFVLLDLILYGVPLFSGRRE